MNTVEIKSEIKSLVPRIRAGKQSFKEAQRKGQWNWQEQQEIRGKVWDLSRRCRHLLIAYGLMRGLAYEQIERPRKGNEPDWKAVEEIRRAAA